MKIPLTLLRDAYNIIQGDVEDIIVCDHTTDNGESIFIPAGTKYYCLFMDDLNNKVYLSTNINASMLGPADIDDLYITIEQAMELFNGKDLLTALMVHDE